MIGTVARTRCRQRAGSGENRRERAGETDPGVDFRQPQASVCRALSVIRHKPLQGKRFFGEFEEQQEWHRGAASVSYETGAFCICFGAYHPFRGGPKHAFAAKTAELLGPHFQLPPEELLPKLEYPPNPDLGDVSLPCFPFAKQLLNADTLLYVVGSEQSLHFGQVFGVLRKLGYDWADRCRHIAFGLMTVDGKKMSTRQGKVVFLGEVLDEAAGRAREMIERKNSGLTDKDATAEAIGVGAIVFGDLKHHKALSFDFRLEEAVSFDGETGPYLQYTHARIGSLLRKGGFDPECPPENLDSTALCTGTAWETVKLLALYETAIAEAVRDNEPFVVARYLLDLGKAFNRFYHAEKILTEYATETTAKLTLACAVQRTLGHGLMLLGVRTPEEL